MNFQQTFIACILSCLQAQVSQPGLTDSELKGMIKTNDVDFTCFLSIEVCNTVLISLIDPTTFNYSQWQHFSATTNSFGELLYKNTGCGQSKREPWITKWGESSVYWNRTAISLHVKSGNNAVNVRTQHVFCSNDSDSISLAPQLETPNTQDTECDSGVLSRVVTFSQGHNPGLYIISIEDPVLDWIQNWLWVILEQGNLV